MSVALARFAITPQAAKGAVQAHLALRAYQLWQQRGRPEGSPEKDWFRAEQKLMATLHMRPREGRSLDDDRWTRFDRTDEVHELIDAKAHDCGPIGWPE